MGDLISMRGFLIVTAAVLLVIGGGVGIMGATASADSLTPCYSARWCAGAAPEFGFPERVLLPSDRDLRFVTGDFSRSTALSSARPRWFLRLQFFDAEMHTSLVWIATPWSGTRMPVCLRSSQEMPVTTADGRRVCAYTNDAALASRRRSWNTPSLSPRVRRYHGLRRAGW
jgi:hypothetical protein